MIYARSKYLTNTFYNHIYCINKPIEIGQKVCSFWKKMKSNSIAGIGELNHCLKQSSSYNKNSNKIVKEFKNQCN